MGTTFYIITKERVGALQVFVHSSLEEQLPLLAACTCKTFDK